MVQNRVLKKDNQQKIMVKKVKMNVAKIGKLSKKGKSPTKSIIDSNLNENNKTPKMTKIKNKIKKKKSVKLLRKMFHQIIIPNSFEW